jgi:diguanylate cyclase (GGDEF)-like protein
MASAQRLRQGLVRFAGCLALALVLAGNAFSQSVRLETLCDRAELFVDSKVPDVGWQSTADNKLELPVRTSCWVRLTRPSPSKSADVAANQFLRFDNSWGSDFSLYNVSGELLARSTVAGERYRTLADKIRVYYPLAFDSPMVLYARVDSVNNFFKVRHTFTQVEGNAIVALQKRALQDVAAGWLLFSASVFSALFYLFQRNRDYALFSVFAFVFSLTLFADRGELVPFGLASSSDALSLSYPLSGLVLAWLALHVGRFALHAPWVARAIQLVIALYAALAGFQLAVMARVPLPTALFETFADLVYNIAAFLQLFVLWGCFKVWRRGDKTSILLAIGVSPLILFEIQISGWFTAAAPALAGAMASGFGSSLRIASYLLLPTMFFIVIAYRAQQVQRDAIRLARQDHLTNLPNRDHFLQLGQSKLNVSKQAVLLAIHIDRLKAINDVLGFQLGDAVLVEVGKRLVAIGEGVVARVQTNQLCLLLPNTERLAQVRSQLESAFAEPVTVLGQTLDVSLSIGMAHSSGEPMTKLLRNADIALGVAKSLKVNWLVYEPVMDTTRPESLSLLSELSRAIEASELRLFLQPKVRLSDGKVTGAEALVRWHHPTRGMVPPNDFIPFAEQTGKISALTIWVIREGARLTADFRRQGQPIVVSVNISTNDIREPQFVERVVAVVHEQGASPSDLRLEVTESGMMEDPRLSLTVLHALRDAGFSLSIDDFGTGYSSLSYLQKMPVAELKIDRSFVYNVQAGTDGAELLDSIIALGHRMGLSVVAEGAETAQECALLQALGCDYLQGWFVAKAMPIAEFVQWLKVNDPFLLNSPK